jgi:plasmid stabilization system protein ParE
MSGFVLHPEAAADIEDIWEYIAADNLDAADRVLEELHEAIHSLVTFPHQGHIRPDLTSKPLRFQSLRDYVIAYVPDKKPLIVIAVLHGRRNPHTIAALLRERR